jgi:hypothetical protein
MNATITGETPKNEDLSMKKGDSYYIEQGEF